MTCILLAGESKAKPRTFISTPASISLAVKNNQGVQAGQGCMQPGAWRGCKKSAWLASHIVHAITRQYGCNIDLTCSHLALWLSSVAASLAVIKHFALVPLVAAVPQSCVIFSLLTAALLLCNETWLMHVSSSMLMSCMSDQVLAGLLHSNCVGCYTACLHCTGVIAATPCRCNRENRHRGLCNSRATIPAAEAVTQGNDAAVEGQQPHLGPGRHCHVKSIAGKRV